MKFFFQRPFEGSVSLLILIRFSVVSFFMNVPGRRTLVTGHIFKKGYVNGSILTVLLSRNGSGWFFFSRIFIEFLRALSGWTGFHPDAFPILKMVHFDL